MAGRRRTALQKAQCRQSIGIINARRRHSHTPATLAPQIHPDLGLAYLQKELEKTQTRLNTSLRKLRNKCREARRAKASRKITRDENRRIAQASRMRARRATGQQERAVRKACTAARTVPGEAYLKAKGGIVKDAVREVIRQLSILNVPEEKMNMVIHAVAKGLGVRVMDRVSSRTVSRILMEGGVAAEQQLVCEIEQEKALTLSGDGTTIRHRNYESRYATLHVPSYTRGDECDDRRQFKARFFGVSSAANHTSEMQFQGLKDHVTRMYTTYNKSPLGHDTPADVFLFATYILGLGTDHAEDQKKLARLILEWKVVIDLELRGQRFLTAMLPSELLPIILKACDEKIRAAGGMAAWEALSEAEKDKRDKETYKGLCCQFGEQEWTKLSEDGKREARLFVWTGCCMHKEMNTVKGGTRAMAEFWKDSKLQGPIKLLNRDNAATVAAGPSKAADDAFEKSEGGAIKVTSLAGAIFNHKDDKKGQQDTFRLYFEDKLGFPVHFPDTSNTRFQSHCEAAGELIVHLPYYLEFLLIVKDSKEKRNFNHMEKNVYAGLTDIPTLTELCVLTLYSQSISHPYMRSVRGSGDNEPNMLDLGPLHTRVKAHKPWERPEAFYAVQQLAPSLPYLEPCLLAFFRGALETWDRFTSEFAQDGIISNLTAAEKGRMHIAATNDRNEGALGSLRVAMRAAPNLSLSKFNSKMMYRQNGTTNWIASKSSAADHKYWRGEARLRDEAGVDKASRRAEIEHIKLVVDGKRVKGVVRKEKADARERVLDELIPELNVSCLKEGKNSSGENLTVAQIRAQINWHRRHDKDILPRTLISKMPKADALTQLIVAVTRYNFKPVVVSQSEGPVMPPIAHDEPMDWEDVEDVEDADMLDID
ncbi:hypothetical protein FPV67DRAFT_1707711 [Lyophyllum atratum]|nr:hypothetical protein FPV67DRAFT_1707711 [Lyophyllum atratum]